MNRWSVLSVLVTASLACGTQEELPGQTVAATSPTLERCVTGMLERLEDLGEVHEELYDTMVGDLMWQAIEQGFILQTPGYEAPRSFGMFSREANGRVRAILSGFLTHGCPAADRQGISTPALRRAAFFDSTVETDQGQPTGAFFGYAGD